MKKHSKTEIKARKKVAYRHGFCARTALCLMVFLLVFAVSCGGAPKYRDDLMVSQLAETVIANASGGKDLVKDNEFATDNLRTVTDMCSEFAFYYNPSASNLDRFGIFHIASEKEVENAKQAILEYSQTEVTALREIADRYTPEESEKLDHANILVCGKYILFSIFSSEDSTAVTAAFYARTTSEEP